MVSLAVFDAYGTRTALGFGGAGLETLWVNRDGMPPDRLPWRPVHVAGGLAGDPDLARRLA